MSIRIDRFGHAAIKVRDLVVSEAFYRDVLGFAVTHRFPEDAELIFGFGADGHLLLQAVGADAPAPDAKTLGVHHVAFVVADGERGLAEARTELDERGIRHRLVDHGDHASVYLHDPDGHMLELYHAPNEAKSTDLVASERWSRARTFLFANARLVDRAAFQVMFERAPADRLVAALESYRNADGGFGHALEPDLRTPLSQPLHTETALAVLKEAGVRRPDIATGCCAFLSGVATTDGALPAFLPGALDYPAAAHWRAGFGAIPTLDRTLGMVALASWHGATHPWLDHAVERCRQHVAHSTIDEAHHLLYAFWFAATVLRGDARRETLVRLRRCLDQVSFYLAATPVARYGLTPLHYAPEPDAAARSLFEDALIDRHLDDLAASQCSDGGWPIRFAPPTEGASIEWRGRFSLDALRTLRAYGRL